MKIVGFVFAHGGSKGIPRKNLCLLGGKPLIVHAIEAALASRHISRVVISTEDVEMPGWRGSTGRRSPSCVLPSWRPTRPPNGWPGNTRFVPSAAATGRISISS